MAATFASCGGSVLGVEEVPHKETDKYGIVEVESPRLEVSRIRSIVEKPKPAEAPSNLAVVGRYVLTPGVFAELEKVGRGAGGEIQLTDGIARLMQHEVVYAHRFAGKRYDCGSKLGYLQATVEHALAHRELGRPFRAYLLQLHKQLAQPVGKGARKRGR
jgi:UTP--glucose-1-phosphate uridylyltransferase